MQPAFPMSSAHEPLIGQPLRIRAVVQILRFLAWSNGLESFLSFLAVAYATGFWVFPAHPAFADAYPLAERVSVALAATGAAGILATNVHWRWLRLGTSAAAFGCWGLLAVGALAGNADMPQRASLTLAALSFAELLVFVRIHIGMDGMADTIEAAAIANNLHVERHGTPLPASIDNAEVQGNVGNDHRGD